jgi:hypothetical protein
MKMISMKRVGLSADCLVGTRGHSEGIEVFVTNCPEQKIDDPVMDVSGQHAGRV